MCNLPIHNSIELVRFVGAWIITGGMNTGIMKLVGEIVQINPDRSRPIHLIVSSPMINCRIDWNSL